MNGTLNLLFDEEIEINSNEIKRTVNKNVLYGIIKPRYEEILRNY